MYSQSIKLLAEAVTEYFSQYELEELCAQFDIPLVYSGTKPDHLKMANNVLSDLDTEKNRQFLHSLVEEMLERCRQAIENLPMGDNLYHQQMIPQLEKFKRLLAQRKSTARTAGRLTEVKLGDQRSSMESFFAAAKTEVTVVDSELAAVILDYMDKVKHPIHLLTNQTIEDIEQAFFSSLKQFRQEGHSVEIRRHADIHDRLILFNKRCWLAGRPLKEAAGGDYELIELIDFKAAIIPTVQQLWKEAEAIILG